MILALAALTTAGCAPMPADRAWIETTRTAWRQQVRAIPGLTPPPRTEVILFDRQCRLSSSDALALRGPVSWTGRRHGGRIRLDDGTMVPVGITSFAGQGRRGPTFVMALPSLWQAAKHPGGPTGLHALTTAVMLHEASHVAQGKLMDRVSALITRQGWGAKFDDDTIQARFEGKPAFAASIAEETRLLFAAAAAPDRPEARRLARQASRLMAARRSAWFTRKDAGLAEAEDLFLTLEGSGQYVGWRWLIDPAGGGFKRPVAMAGWGQRGRWWSQRHGLALLLAVERLGLAGWTRQVWGPAERTGKPLLDAALARAAVTSYGNDRTRRGSR